MEGSSVNTVKTINTTVQSQNGLPSNTVTTVNTVNNTVVNSNMKNPPLNVGVIVPPDAHYKPILYSHIKATQEFNQLDHDIYESVKKSKNIREKKTPLSVYIIGAIGALAIAFPFIKKYFK